MPAVVAAGDLGRVGSVALGVALRGEMVADLQAIAQALGGAEVGAEGMSLRPKSLCLSLCLRRNMAK